MIDRVEFGRTGHRSSRVIFGAAALGTMHQDRADQVLESLDAFGVNHLDTAAGYGDSELRLAPWLAKHRDRFFLATKTGDRTADSARASLERSLNRLGVDRVDLIQLHNLVEEDEWQTAHGPHGALEALIQARDEGLTRFIGVTGHGLRIAAMHRRSLERFDYDSVLLPYNYALLGDEGYQQACQALLARAPNGEWRCRRSSPPPVGGGPPTTPRPTSAGTNPCLRDERWPARCSGCWAAVRLTVSCSSIPPATPGCCPRFCRRPPTPPPSLARPRISLTRTYGMLG